MGRHAFKIREGGGNRWAESTRFSEIDRPQESSINQLNYTPYIFKTTKGDCFLQSFFVFKFQSIRLDYIAFYSIHYGTESPALPQWNARSFRQRIVRLGQRRRRIRGR